MISYIHVHICFISYILSTLVIFVLGFYSITKYFRLTFMSAAVLFPTSGQILTFTLFAVSNSVIFYLYDDANIMLIIKLKSLI